MFTKVDPPCSRLAVTRPASQAFFWLTTYSSNCFLASAMETLRREISGYGSTPLLLSASTFCNFNLRILFKFTAINITKIFRPRQMRELRESNPRSLFWRQQVYHLPKLPWTTSLSLCELYVFCSVCNAWTFP